MSTNTRALQKRAAEMVIAGYENDQIAARLGVRLLTVMRWRQAPRFLAHLSMLKKLKAQDYEMKTLLLLREALSSLESGGPYGLGLKDGCAVIAALRNMEQLRIFEDEVPQNQPKSARISRNQRQPAPNQPPSAGISNESIEKYYCDESAGGANQP